MESTAYSTGVGHAPTGSQANEVEAGPNRLASAAQSRARARRRQDRATRKHCRGGGRGKRLNNCRRGGRRVFCEKLLLRTKIEAKCAGKLLNIKKKLYSIE